MLMITVCDDDRESCRETEKNLRRYMDEKTGKFASFKEEKHMVNASGAGDALMAAFLYGEVMGLPITETIDLGMAAGIAAIRCPSAINENMSIGLLQQIIKENKEI